MNCYFCSNYSSTGKATDLLLTWPRAAFPGNLFPGWSSQRRFQAQNAWNFFELVESHNAQVRKALGDLSGTYVFPSRTTPTRINPPPLIPQLWYTFEGASQVTIYREGGRLHQMACPTINWTPQRNLPLPTAPLATVYPGFCSPAFDLICIPTPPPPPPQQTPMIITLLIAPDSFVKEFDIPIMFEKPSDIVRVDWGDGTIISGYNPTKLPEHTYNPSSPTTYTVKIYGTASGYGGVGNYNGVSNITEVVQWGTLGMTKFPEAFPYANLLAKVPSTFVPNVTDVHSMFTNCGDLSCDVSMWDVSNVTNMNSMFKACSKFNSNLSSWNISKVTNTGSMFSGAFSFDQPLNAWDVSGVTNMSRMFESAQTFNQPLNNWKVHNVTTMLSMFADAQSFNQDISAWDIRKVTTMNSMFSVALAFNQPLNAWDVSGVTDMGGMFSNTVAFNQPLNAWNVSGVTNMSSMFFTTGAFNQPLNAWNVSSVTDMSFMFSKTTMFNQPLDSWNTQNVRDMSYMFSGNFDVNPPIPSLFYKDISGWNVGLVTQAAYIFYYSPMCGNTAYWPPFIGIPNVGCP